MWMLGHHQKRRCFRILVSSGGRQWRVGGEAQWNTCPNHREKEVFHVVVTGSWAALSRPSPCSRQWQRPQVGRKEVMRKWRPCRSRPGPDLSVNSGGGGWEAFGAAGSPDTQDKSSGFLSSFLPSFLTGSGYCSSGWPWTLLLPGPLKCWGHRCTPLHTAYLLNSPPPPCGSGDVA